jgi:integrase
MEMRAVQAAIAAIKSLGVAEDQIEAALRGLGVEMPAAAPSPGKSAKTVSTEAQVKAKAPGVYRVTGVRRLYLKKSARDAGSYFLRYRINGKRPEMGLGSIADTSLPQARGLAEEFSVKISRKSDPLAERRAERAAASEKASAEALKATELTVKQAVETYLKANVSRWQGVYARSNWFNPIETHAFPVIGSLKVSVVEPRHILAVIKAMDDKGVPVLASKVRSRLKTVFDYLAAHGLRDTRLGNPADAGVINAGNASVSDSGHFRRIELDAAPDAFMKLVSLAPSNVPIACWAFMALTAARPGEALAARWDQIDRNKKLWLNPAPKTKKARKAKGKAKAEDGKPLPVPLSDLALAVLDMAESWRRGDLIFPGRGGGKLAHSSFATMPMRAAKGDAGSPHSWRSIFRDVVEDKCGFRPETAEAALGHSLGAVEGAYRRETAFEARIPMMQAYADWLLGRAAGNVVALKGRA